MKKSKKKLDEASLGRMRVISEEKEDVIERLRDIERRLEEKGKKVRKSGMRPDWGE